MLRDAGVQLCESGDMGWADNSFGTVEVNESTWDAVGCPSTGDVRLRGFGHQRVIGASQRLTEESIHDDALLRLMRTSQQKLTTAKDIQE